MSAPTDGTLERLKCQLARIVVRPYPRDATASTTSAMGLLQTLDEFADPIFPQHDDGTDTDQVAVMRDR